MPLFTAALYLFWKNCIYKFALYRKVKIIVKCIYFIHKFGPYFQPDSKEFMAIKKLNEEMLKNFALVNDGIAQTVNQLKLNDLMNSYDDVSWLFCEKKICYKILNFLLKEVIIPLMMMVSDLFQYLTKFNKASKEVYRKDFLSECSGHHSAKKILFVSQLCRWKFS